MTEATMLLAAIFIPLVGAVLLALPPVQRVARGWALGITLLTLAVAAIVVVRFPQAGDRRRSGPTI
jgi:NADH:ubiquinone oxidoreductase subunit 4 (subunit M)